MKHFFPPLLFLFILNAPVFSQSLIFSPRGVGGGGALFFPKINPANDNEFYISCDMSELFHSTDFGNNYTQIPFTKLPVLNTSTYEYTSNPSIAYSNYNDGNNGYPVKTADGGATWMPLPGFDASSGSIYRMAANYSNPSQLLMNYYGKIVFSNNGGTSFQLVKQAANNGVGIIMAGSFFDGANIYIGTNEGIYYSTNSGSTFSLMPASGIPATEVIWHFSAAKTGATTRFVCITGLSSNTYNGIMPWDYYGFAKGVYTMDNAGGVWQSKSAGLNFSNDFVLYTGMASNDISTVYLAGHDNSLGAPLIYKSVNAGTSWSKVFQSTNNQNIITGWSGTGGDKQWSWGETAFGIAVAPNNSSKVLFGDYSFVHVSSDGGASWKQAYVNNTDQHPAAAATPLKLSYHSIGLENTTCWQVDWQSATGMMAAFSDIGAIKSTDGGSTWGFNYNGMSVNSVYRIANTAAGTRFAATSGIHDMYQSTRLKDAQLDAADASGKIMFSSDNGANWSLLHSFGHPVFWLAVDPGNANKMYASVIHYGGGGAAMQGGIWMTSNGNSLAAATWTHLPNPPRTEGHPASITVLNDGKVLCTFSGRINAGSQFTASSGVFLYDPATNGWTDLSDPNMQFWTKDIVVDPSDVAQNTWYACVFSGWANAGSGRGGLYKTANRGVSWTKLTGTQFDRVTSITINPQNGANAYLTTETQGLWSSHNFNTALPTWTLETGYPFRQPERVYFNPYKPSEMWVTSFGNGLKVASLGQIGVSSQQSSISQLNVYPNPGNSSIHISLPIAGNMIEIYGSDGKMVYRKQFVDKGIITVDVHSLSPGNYIIKYGRSTARWIKN